MLLAIIAVGFNASYAIWVSRAAKEPEHELHVLRGVKFLDDRIANPAYGVLLLTGLWMVRLGHYRLFDTFWLETALDIYIVTALTAALVVHADPEETDHAAGSDSAPPPNTRASPSARISSARCSACSWSASCS